MFHIVSKVFTFFIMPEGILTILLLYAFYTKNRTKSRRSIMAALIFFYIFSTSVIVSEFIRLWEEPPTSISVVKAHDVGIVLTGGITANNKMPTENLFFAGSSDRIWQALQLYKRGKIKKILLSGGEVTVFGKSKAREIDQCKQYLLISGVPEEDIILEDLSTNTRENATNSAKILKERFPNQRYILITSAFHMKRSIGCFEKVGINTTPYCSNFIVGERRFSIIDFLPAASNMQKMHLVYREIIGYISYQIFGWI